MTSPNIILTAILEKYNLVTVEDVVQFDKEIFLYLESIVKLYTFKEDPHVLHAWNEEENKNIIEKRKAFSESLNQSFQNFVTDFDKIKATLDNTKVDTIMGKPRIMKKSI